MTDISDNNEELSNSSKMYALFYSFFLIPLMLTIFAVLFFFLFKMLTYEKQDPYHLLNNINSGSLTKRWQSAYELSNLMSDLSKVPNDEIFFNQIKSMYDKSIHDDPRVRTYLALAMGQTGNSTFCDNLTNGYNIGNLENNIAIIKSLGMLDCQSSVKLLNEIVVSEKNNQEKLAAVISLGLLNHKSSIKYLIKALDNEEANIRWDAAISLAKAGDQNGYGILKNLLNREYYSNYEQVDGLEINNSILTVLALVSSLDIKFFEYEINALANNDRNLKIREFAMKILSEYY